MLMMSLPAVLAPVAAVLAALMAVITGLTFSRPKRFTTPHDVEREIADLTMKVRSPWAYRVRKVERWMSGD